MPAKIIDCWEQTAIEAARRAAALRATPFLFMLKDLSGRWILEARYASQAKLDAAVEVYAKEYREDNDGHAPEAGRDFLAVQAYDYVLIDAEPAMPDFEERRITATM